MDNLLTRAVDRLSASARTEDQDLRAEARRAGCVPICDQRDRQEVTLHGTLRSVTLRPRSDLCALEAELYDGSGSVRLVWLGRRRIAGIEAGRRLTVVGRVAVERGERVLYNPRYELAA